MKVYRRGQDSNPAKPEFFHAFFLQLDIVTYSTMVIFFAFIFSSNNNNNNKLYLHDQNKVLQYCKSYLKLLIDSL